MSFIITGLAAEEFEPLFGLSDESFRSAASCAKKAAARSGYPCRTTLEDAEPVERILLLNYESQNADTPYRSTRSMSARARNRRKPTPTNCRREDRSAFADPEAAYIHAHNAAHDCFAAEIRRAGD